MKVSLNWVKQFTDINLGIDELVEKIGAQIGAVEEVIDIGKRYEGVVIAKIVSCEKHPNADKLSVCLIDDGKAVEGVERNEQGYVQVVCGAQNARDGITVAWLPPGSTVPSTYDKDPFVLEARELRGVVSNGMLASGRELAINEDHEGIIEVDIDAGPGRSFAEVYELNDYVIDIENKMFTHRPDCFGILGVAREIAGVQNVAFKSPDWYLSGLDRIKPGGTKLPIVVRNEVSELVPRFMAVAMADVEIKASPLIVQTYLQRVGIKPINNVVDVTNYLMVLTGQPLHAYDYDKVKALNAGDEVTIVIRKPKASESLVLLNGKTIEPRADAIMIATDKQLIGVGGVMGGDATEVDEETKNVILECATFDMYSVRRTSMAHGLFTDAVTRFNKGQSPLQNDRVLEEAVATLEYVSGAHVASDVIDEHGELPERQTVEASKEFVTRRLGLEMGINDLAERLRNVEFDVKVAGEALSVMPPFWRTDIEIAEDVVEEVGRLVGFDKLPVELPSRSIKATQRSPLLSLKTSVRTALSVAGANEVLTYSFVHGDLLGKVGQDKEQAYKLSNAISPDLQYYRLSLTPSLLEKVYPNIRAGFDEFAMFEIGKSHNSSKPMNDEGVPPENEMISLVYASSSDADGAAYYQAKRLLDYLCKQLGTELTYKPITDEQEDAVTKPFDLTRSAYVHAKETDTFIGIIGEFRSDVRRKLKLPEHTAGFEIGTEHLLSVGGASIAEYTELPKFPAVEQDISLKVDPAVRYGELYQVVSGYIEENKPSNSLAILSDFDIFQKNKDDKRITFRLKVASYERTLTADEINKLLDDAAATAKTKLGAERL